MATLLQKITFHSQEGQHLLAETDTIRQAYLISLFRQQVGRAMCGIQSTALLLSARHLGLMNPNLITPVPIDGDTTNLPYTEANMFSFKETTTVLDIKLVKIEGCTLEQIHSLFLSHGYNSTKHHSECTTEVDTFRSLACKALSHKDSRCGVIVNYDEAALGQDINGSGHFSPLAGYNHATDMFLLLDTWWNTDVVWVKTSFLFETMCTVDRRSGKYRGFIILQE